MRNNFINKKNFFIVDKGIFIIIIIFLLVVLSLYFIKFNNQSIIERVYKYYLNIE